MKWPLSLRRVTFLFDRGSIMVRNVRNSVNTVSLAQVNCKNWCCLIGTTQVENGLMFDQFIWENCQFTNVVEFSTILTKTSINKKISSSSKKKNEFYIRKWPKLVVLYSVFATQCSQCDEQVHGGKARSHSGIPFFLNCIYWLEAIESNWMKRPVIYERLSGANYLSIHSVLSLHSFIIHSRRCTVVACIAVVKAHSIDRWLSKL